MFSRARFVIDRATVIVGVAVAIAIVLSVGIESAHAQTALTRAEVRSLLSGIEATPSAADWRRIGPRVLPHLIALYNEPREAPFVRLRAIDATGAFPTPATRTFLLAVVRARPQNDLFARRAVTTLARAFGSRAIPDLIEFLDHREPTVREAAVNALAVHGSDAERALLRHRLPRERSRIVQDALRRALRR